MAALTTTERRLLEKKVAEARRIAESGARLAIEQLGVTAPRSRHDLGAEEARLHTRLRARGRQLGDERKPGTGEQEIHRLVEAAAYEHWHRLLFARFLAEGGFLLDPATAVPLALDELEERARIVGRDWLELAVEYARPMLLSVFRPRDPILDLRLPPETRQGLERVLEAIPREAFLAEDSLGWVYQFWQGERKAEVNRSEEKIGADAIAPVTQLFTDDYIVLFLLHNTLGAWWTAKRREENKNPELPGYTWEYLRLNDDGTPAAGGYDAWPRAARELRVLDPCMGSGHFLAFALPIVVRMRMEEEGISLEDALCAVLRDNLFGIEIDDRCSQIAAFNLALTAWRLAGRQFPLPALNLACSGLHINAPLADWLKLAHGVAPIESALKELFELFSEAPLFGSLIDPRAAGQRVGPLLAPLLLSALESALGTEDSDYEQQEMVIAARGLLSASRLLMGSYTLVATNVPYLEQRNQATALRTFCARYYGDAKGDLATTFVARLLPSLRPGGVIAAVTPQNWLSLVTYYRFRKTLLSTLRLRLFARLGPQAFEAITGHVVKPALIIVEQLVPNETSNSAGLDVSAHRNTSQKALALRRDGIANGPQVAMIANPKSRIAFGLSHGGPTLGSYCACLAGIMNGDSPRFQRFFWEFPEGNGEWAFQQTTVSRPTAYGGLEKLIYFDAAEGHLRADSAFRREQLHNSDTRGKEAWGKRGVAVSQTGDLAASLYGGEKFDSNVAVVIPGDVGHLAAVWAFLKSAEFAREVRKLDPKLNVTNATLGEVPFDLARWQREAKEEMPDGIPGPPSASPAQWPHNGEPRSSNAPLQTAVARLLGYEWPRQTGSSFMDCPALGPDGLEQHAAADGIACLSPLDGQEDAATRLRRLLQAAYGGEWSHEHLKKLIGGEMSLEEWLRDRFFAEHCELFHQRPFIWHIWDGLKGGFHALVNYHRLCGANGDGRRTLERLTYTYLGDWLRRQEDGVKNGASGAEVRLVAAQHLRAELEKILQGEAPYDIFVRWKPLHEQAIGWEPDINDGIRLNIRPWLMAKTHQAAKSGTKNACILRAMPKVRLGVDRGKEPARHAESFPWFAGNPGKRDNDIHLTLSEKRAARDLHGRETHSRHAGGGAS